jgi:hypothetical protein
MKVCSIPFVFVALLPVSGAYVTSPGAVPVNRQEQWLRVRTFSDLGLSRFLFGEVSFSLKGCLCLCVCVCVCLCCVFRK